MIFRNVLPSWIKKGAALLGVGVFSVNVHAVKIAGDYPFTVNGNSEFSWYEPLPQEKDTIVTETQDLFFQLSDIPFIWAPDIAVHSPQDMAPFPSQSLPWDVLASCITNNDTSTGFYTKLLPVANDFRSGGDTPADFVSCLTSTDWGTMHQNINSGFNTKNSGATSGKQKGLTLTIGEHTSPLSFHNYPESPGYLCESYVSNNDKEICQRNFYFAYGYIMASVYGVGTGGLDYVNATAELRSMAFMTKETLDSGVKPDQGVQTDAEKRRFYDAFASLTRGIKAVDSTTKVLIEPLGQLQHMHNHMVSLWDYTLSQTATVVRAYDIIGLSVYSGIDTYTDNPEEFSITLKDEVEKPIKWEQLLCNVIKPINSKAGSAQTIPVAILENAYVSADYSNSDDAAERERAEMQQVAYLDYLLSNPLTSLGSSAGGSNRSLDCNTVNSNEYQVPTVFTYDTSKHDMEFLRLSFAKDMFLVPRVADPHATEADKTYYADWGPVTSKLYGSRAKLLARYMDEKRVSGSNIGDIDNDGIDSFVVSGNCDAGGGANSGTTVSFTYWDGSSKQVDSSYCHNSVIGVTINGDTQKIYSDNCPFIWNEDQEDDDGDGIGDFCDNCPNHSNGNQEDGDADGTGDACDGSPGSSQDEDGDGLSDFEELEQFSNPWKKDSDCDGVNDNTDAFPNEPCDKQGHIYEDTDTDGDGVGDNKDAFPSNASAWLDTDDDGEPDFCDGSCTGGLVEDTDDDEDGVADAAPDNCQLVKNGILEDDQLDTDGDDMGDACDEDDDNDGVKDDYDAYPTNPSAWTDTDSDGAPDSCDGSCTGGLVEDTDDDADGVADASPDNCPLVRNGASEDSQLDTDGDGIGDACDADDDNDGIPDGFDGCPTDSTQSVDVDKDGICDNSDTDDDNDGLSDAYETGTSNTSSQIADSDNDGLMDNEEVDTDGVGGADDCTNDPCTNPLLFNTDGDWALISDNSSCTSPWQEPVGDKDEIDLSLDPLVVDTDGDGIGDLHEMNGQVPGVNIWLCGPGTDHTKADTDADGLSDGEEAGENGYGTAALDRQDPPLASANSDLLFGVGLYPGVATNDTINVWWDAATGYYENDVQDFRALDIAHSTTGFFWLDTTGKGNAMLYPFNPFYNGGDGVTVRGANSAGSDYPCVIKTNGTVWCGSLDGGSGTTTDGYLPSMSSVTDITVSDGFACAIDAGNLKCWGPHNASLPTYPAGNSIPSSVTLSSPSGVAVASGEDYVCVVKDDDSIQCWGNKDPDDDPLTPEPPVFTDIPASVEPKSIGSGDSHVCIVDGAYLPGDTSVECWGDNGAGQLNVPAELEGSNVVFVRSGQDQNCAVLAEGYTASNLENLVCWPTVRDTDADTFSDRCEVGQGTDPLDPSSKPASCP